MLGGDPQRLPARCEHPNLWRGVQQHGGQPPDLGYEVLAIVEYQQQAPSCHALEQDLRRATPKPLASPDNRQQRFDELLLVRHAGEQGYLAVRPILRRSDAIGQLERQTCLAASSGTRHGQQLGADEHPLQLDELGLAADQRTHGHHPCESSQKRGIMAIWQWFSARSPDSLAPVLDASILHT